MKPAEWVWEGSLGAVEGGLSGWSLLAAVLLMLINLVVSVQLSLNLHKPLLLATARCVVQLSILSYILALAFKADYWWLTLIYFFFMLLVSAIDSVSRPPAAHEGMLTQVVVSMGTSSALVMLFGVLLVFRPRPWSQAQTLLPALGMVLCSASTAVALALSAAIEELTAGRDRVELLLAIGATRMEASRSVIQKSLTTALTPSLNQLSVVGLASLPEFLGGQLISGSPPLKAARVQIVIMLLGITCACLAATAAVFATVFSCLDASHRLRPERLAPRHGRQAGVAQWVHAQAVKALTAARQRCHRAFVRVRVAWGQRSYRPASRSGTWLPPLTQRVFGRRQGGGEYDEVASLDSRLRGVGQVASDDESVFSGGMSEADDLFPRAPLSPMDNSRRNLMSATQRSEPG